MQLGIEKMAAVLAPTLGPAGTPVFCEGNQRTKVEWLDDAATIARRIISLGDPRLDVGAMLVRNVVWRVDQRAGDGGATAAVLMRAIFEAGLRQITAGANAMQITRGIRLGVEAAQVALAAQAEPRNDEALLAAVARTMTRDEDLSAVLGEMSALLGPDAQVQIETYVAPYLQRIYLAGAAYAAKIASSYLYSEMEKKRAVLVGPAVALLDRGISTAEQAAALMRAAVQAGHTSLLIIAQDVAGAALSTIVANHVQPAEQRKLAVLAVKITPVGEERTWALRDLAMLTGASLLGPLATHSVDHVVPEDLGRAQRVEFSSERLAVVVAPERRVAAQEAITTLRSRLETLALDDAERPTLTKRLAALSGGIGVLKVGAYSKLAQDLRRTQSERTLKALSAVQRSGVVAGGGAALVHCGAAVRRLEASSGEPDDVRLGMRLLADALSAPLRQLVTNAHVPSPALVVHNVAEAGAPYTFDAERMQVVDAHAAGVLDAADIVATVLNVASSGATMALSTDAIVYHKRPQQSFQP